MKSGGESGGHSEMRADRSALSRPDRRRDTSETVRRIAAEYETHGGRYTIKGRASALVIRKSPECCALDSGVKREFEERGALSFFFLLFF